MRRKGTGETTKQRQPRLRISTPAERPGGPGGPASDGGMTRTVVACPLDQDRSVASADLFQQVDPRDP